MDIDKLKHFVAHGFLVDDIQQEEDFYTQNLGYTVGRRGDSFVSLTGGPAGGLFLWAWGHISKHLGPEASGRIGHRSMQAIHLESREEVDEAYEALRDKATFIAPPQDWVWKAYAAYFVDNQNYLWELWTWNE